VWQIGRRRHDKSYRVRGVLDRAGLLARPSLALRPYPSSDFADYRSSVCPPSAEDVIVSIIVPVRNGAADIASLLARLERQTVPRTSFEVVIGDDGSTDDGTKNAGTADRHVIVAAGPPTNSYAARNRAVQASRGRVLAFCDADCRPEDDWLERGLEALEHVDIAAGRIRFSVPPRRTFWTLIDMDGSKDHEHQVRVGVAETANLFLRRELFDHVGGFEATIAEYGDYEFVERCVASGAHLSFAPEAVVWHPVRSSGRALLRALWKYNRGYAVHATRAGSVPDGVKLRSWVPVIQTLRARRRWNRSLGPDRGWLAANGVHPSFGETLSAVAVMYLVLPYLCNAAQVAGWLDGRRFGGADSADVQRVLT
jgi:GT2 family glycosyltransferase